MKKIIVMVSAFLVLMSTTAFTDLKFSLASAMGWLYFLLIGIFLVIIQRLFRHLIFSYDQ